MRIAVIALTLAAASPALAGNNELTIGGTYRSLRTASANAVTDENLGGVQLTAARQIHLDLMTNLQIWGVVGFAHTSAEGELFGMPTTIDATDILLGGNARYELHSHLAVVARVDLGPSKNSLSIEGNGHRVSDGRWGMAATGALGLDLLIVNRPQFSFGWRAELGYVAHSATALSPVEGSSGDMLELSGSQASVGHLDLGGRYFAISLLSQF
jgi:hypothetical protein